MTKESIKDLSIQVKLNGLSFCIFDSSTNSVLQIVSLDFEHKLTPNAVLLRLKEELVTNTIFSEDFNSVHLIHFNELSTLVPKSLFNEANAADYLKFNSKILKTDYIAHDVLEADNMVNVYVPYININNYIFETFGAFTYKHASTVFIDTLSSTKYNDQYIFINVEHNAMQLSVIIDNDLKLYNFFEFLTPEDFIYYILFVVEQLQLNPETINLCLSGIIDKDDDLYNIAYKYIRHVGFVTNSPPKLATKPDTDFHKHFILKQPF